MSDRESRWARPGDELRRHLDVLVSEGARYLHRERLRRAFPLALERFLDTAGLFALASLGAALLLALFGGPVLSGLQAVAWSLGLGLAAALVPLGRAHFRPLSRRDALAVYDHGLALGDRLLTAEQFLGVRKPDGFMQAALADAVAAAEEARGSALVPTRATWSPDWRLAGLAAALAALLLLGLRGERVPELGGDEREVARVGAGVDASAPRVDDSAAPQAPPEPELAETLDPATRRDATPAGRRADSGIAELADPTRSTPGRAGEGRSSEAQSASRSSQSRGVPSGQSQRSETPPAKKVDPKKTEPKADTEAEQPRKKANEEDSGSTAGQGASKGSGKNPAASAWTSKDQVSTPDDADLEEDEEVDDDDEEQESRGGVQPSLRDRRPPVSRDLQIGFGNRPNPDANGRGGPSAAKKSRGVASLVLGVPIPDRVKGQPNPGRTKITQERIEPQAEEVAPRTADARAPRSTSPGSLAPLDLDPSLRQMVRRYFLTLRRGAPEGR